jgi:hypothetical protein
MTEKLTDHLNENILEEALKNNSKLNDLFFNFITHVEISGEYRQKQIKEYSLELIKHLLSLG